MINTPAPVRNSGPQATTARTASSTGQGSADPSKGGDDFLDLFGALQDGGSPEVAEAKDADAADEDAADSEEAEDADDLLASMAAAQWLPVTPPATPAAPAAGSASPAPAGGSPGGSAAALAGTVANAIATAAGVATDAMADTRSDAAATGKAGDLAAALTQVATDADASLLFGKDAAAAANGEPAAPQNPNASLNAWAAAANRAAGIQDASGRAAQASPESALREPVGTPRWKDELGSHLTLMTTQGQQSGSLRLSPEHLGPLEIQITVADDKTTSVQFNSQHAETRAALQDAMPRLRELFASAGLQLGDAGVSGHAPRSRPQDIFAAAGGVPGARDGEPTRPSPLVRSITHSGLLDTYA
jgi:flagellar hook-length control protein FliK